MFKKFIKLSKNYYIILFFTHNILSPSTIQEKLCTLYLPQKSTNWYFADQTNIEFQNQNSFLLFAMKSQQIITQAYINLFTKIENKLGVSIEELYDLFGNETIMQDFYAYQQQKLNKIYLETDTILEEDIDPSLLIFLQENFKKYNSVDNIQFILNPHIPYIADTFYDSKEEKYIIILNSTFYALENITEIQKKETTFFSFYNKTHHGETGYINYKDLIHSGFILASSTIHHKFKLLNFILANYKFYGTSASDEILLLLNRIISFQIDLEAILQTNNPLEVAYFYQTIDPFIDNKKHWTKLIQSIEKMYDQKSLQKFQKIFTSTKQKIDEIL